jgi:tetratricopeptide (TPR) repeat protein
MSCTGDQLIERFMAAAAKAASEAGSTTQSIHLLGRLAEAAAFSGDLARSEAFARMAVAKGGGDTRGTWRATAARAMCDFFRGRAAASDSTYREIVNGLSTQPTPTVVDLISNWAVVRMELEKFEEARHDLEYCRDFYQATRHPVAAARAQGNLAALEWEAGNHAIASGRAEETLASGSWLPSEVVATAMGVAGMVEVETRWESAVERRRRLLASWPDQLLMQSDLSYAYMFLARMSEREGKRADALERIEDGLALYAGRDFFCHARLQLEKARLIGVKDPEAGLALAREVRARALEGEATLLLNKSEALIRELKRGTQARAQGGGRTEAGAGARKKIMPRMTRRHPGDSDQSK